MNCQTSNVVWVRLEGRNLLVRIVIEHSQLKIIRARNKPVLARDKAYATDRNLRDLERLHDRARFMVIDVHTSVIKTR